MHGTCRESNALWQLQCSNVSIELRKVQIRRYLPMGQNQSGLEHTGSTGGCLQMTNVGLECTDQELFSRLSTVHASQDVHLDRVTEWCSSAVRLDIRHSISCDTSVRECRADHPLLCRCTRCRQAIRRGPCMIHGRTNDFGQWQEVLR